MKLKGALWAASLFIFSLAAYLAIPTQTLRNHAMSASSITRAVTKKVLAVETPEGQGALVRRSIGSTGLRNLTPFLMLDHFHVKTGGFPDHPHRGQSTVTYMLEGSSDHEDSVGHKGTIQAGGVQWMVAGRGIMHSEMQCTPRVNPTPVGLQLWVNLPKKYKMVEPSYQELDASGIPTAYPHGPDGPSMSRSLAAQVTVSIRLCDRLAGA
ncbi:RmlC-like cupin domain-containing protein, partial [Mycena leptocephala]